MQRLVLVLLLVLTACAGTEEPAGDGPSTSPDATVTLAPTTTSAATTAPPATTSPTTMPSTTTLGPPAEPPPLRLVEIASGFGQPVLLTSPPRDPRLFVVDQPGRIWLLAADAPEVFLDVRDSVTFGGERGLLGLAFHPEFATNGRFFVNYTDGAGDTRIVEFAVSADDPDRADPASGRVLLQVDQPAGNHNGGMIAFGPDGHLWVGMGDGGASGDRFGNGQNEATLLGSMLRLDVDGADPYAIPAGNDFVAPESWAIGLRNPWRFSFDDGLLYVADVGQNELEEVSVVDTTATRLNFGWPIQEATSCFRPSSGCDTSGLVQPVIEYGHGGQCSITGGYVYRGAAIPELEGTYFYGDWCGGWVRSFRFAEGTVADERDWTEQLGKVPELTSFGVDANGEIYVVSGSGAVFRIERAD